MSLVNTKGTAKMNRTDDMRTAVKVRHLDGRGGGSVYEPHPALCGVRLPAEPNGLLTGRSTRPCKRCATVLGAASR